jgi:hypothetical protein
MATTNFRSIAGGDGFVMIAGSSGNLAISTDGTRWASNLKANPTSNEVWDMMYVDADKVFVAGADNGILTVLPKTGYDLFYPQIITTLPTPVFLSLEDRGKITEITS